ncbi:hypothetical protein QYF61_018205, partial [Mycteria americana]
MAGALGPCPVLPAGQGAHSAVLCQGRLLPSSCCEKLKELETIAYKAVISNDKSATNMAILNRDMSLPFLLWNLLAKENAWQCSSCGDVGQQRNWIHNCESSVEAVSWGCCSLCRMQSGSSGKTLGVEAVPAAASAGYKQCARPMGLSEGEATDIPVLRLTMQPSFSKAVVGRLFGRALLWKASDLK